MPNHSRTLANPAIGAVCRILGTLLAFGGLLVSGGRADAAKMTDVLDARYGDSTSLDFSLSLHYFEEHESCRVMRERNNDTTTQKNMIDQDEFDLKSVKRTFQVKAALGLHKDLELRLMLPAYVHETYSGHTTPQWVGRYWGGGVQMPFNRPSLIADRVIGFPAWESIHRGFGDMQFGLAWAPVSNNRDPAYPTWLLSFDLELPTGTETSPTMEPSAGNIYKGTGPNMGVGKKLVTFLLSTAISMRSGVADPYFGLFARLPVSTGGLIKTPRKEGGFYLGTELVAFERKPSDDDDPLWKVAFDFRLTGTFHSQGQEFNEMTDALAWRRGKSNQDPSLPGNPNHPDGIYWPEDPRVRYSPANVYYSYPDGRAPDYELPMSSRYFSVQGLFGFSAVLYHYLNIGSEFLIGHRTNHYYSVPEKIDTQTLRPADRSGYYAQINETGARIKKNRSLVIGYTLTLGFLY